MSYGHEQTLFGFSTGSAGDVLVGGLPFDHGSTKFPGCALAPDVLRHLSSDLRVGDRTLREKVSQRPALDGARFSDLGNVAPRPTQSREAYLEDVSQVVEAAFREGKRTFLFGGDHLATLPALRGIARAGRDFQLVQIDAHSDFTEVKTGECLPTHANFVHFAERLPELKRIVQVGVRGFSCRERSLPGKIRQVELAALAENLAPAIPVYLSVDTDGFDPLLAPAVGHPEPGGLGWDALEIVLAALRGKRLPLLGADWMEYNPGFDSKNYLTGRHVVRAAVSILSALQGDSDER